MEHNSIGSAFQTNGALKTFPDSTELLKEAASKVLFKNLSD